MTRVAAIQMTAGLDVGLNLNTACKLVQEAAETGAELVLLPEMFLCMDGKQYPMLAAEQDWLEALKSWCRSLNIWLVAGAVPMPSPNPEETRVRSACLVIDHQGDVVGRYDKIHLFDVDVSDAQGAYRESRRFEPGSGVVVIDSPVGKLGLSICYDVRFPELFRQLREQGAEVILVPAAFTHRTGAAHWEVLLRARAIESQCFVLACNQCGWHDEHRQTWGHSMLIDGWGKVLGQLQEGEGVLVADVDSDSLESLRQSMPVMNHRRLV